MSESTFLISYTIDASTDEQQYVLYKGMREILEDEFYTINLDDTLWYIIDDSGCVTIEDCIVDNFIELNDLVGGDIANISVSVNQVIDWSLWEHKKVAKWLKANESKPK